MPEGDTIRRLANHLSGRFAGQLVQASTFRHPRLASLELKGTTFVEADARGKHLLMRFSNGYTIHVTLRMAGRVHANLAKVSPHRRKFEIEFEGGWVSGVDTPVLQVLRTADEHRVVGYLGPDVCGAYRHDDAVARLAGVGAIALSQALLDQQVIAGFGNIYAVEVPFIVGVCPLTTVDRLPDVSGLLAIGVALIRSNAERGPQNTTGMRLHTSDHWVLNHSIFQCKVCHGRLERVASADSPWQRRFAWCPACQPSDVAAVDLHRAAKLLALHPCRKLVDLKSGRLTADVSVPVRNASAS